MLQLARTFLGSCVAERACGGFKFALRRASVPAEAVPEHSHATAHFIYALDEGYETSALRAAEFGGVCLVYNPPGVVHRDCFDEKSANGRFLAIDFPVEIAAQGVDHPVVIDSTASRKIAASIVGLMLEGASAVDLEDRALSLITSVSSHTQHAANKAPPWLERAVAAISDLSNDARLDVNAIARIVNVHPVHLARVCSIHFGSTPGELLRRRRTERALSLLGSSEPLSDVAAQAGFADQSHMTRAFRSTFGATPAVIRAAF